MKYYVLIFSIIIILFIIGYHIKESYVDNNTQVTLDDLNADITDLGYKISVTNKNLSQTRTDIGGNINNLQNKINTNNKQIYNHLNVLDETTSLTNNELADLSLDYYDYKKKSNNKFTVIDGQIVNINNYFSSYKNDTDKNINTQLANINNNLTTNLNSSVKSATDNLNSMFNNFTNDQKGNINNINNNVSSLSNLLQTLNIDYNTFKTSTNIVNNATGIDIKNIKTNLTDTSNLINSTLGQLNQLTNVLNTAYTKTIDNDIKYIKRIDLNSYPTFTDVESRYTPLKQSANYINKTEIKFYIDQMKAAFQPYFDNITKISTLLTTVKTNVDTITNSYVNKVDLPKLAMDATNNQFTIFSTSVTSLKDGLKALNDNVTGLTNNINNNYVKKTDADLSYATFAKKTDLSSYVAKTDMKGYGYALAADLTKGLSDINATIAGIKSSTVNILDNITINKNANVNSLFVDPSSYSKTFPTGWNGLYTKDIYATGNIGIGAGGIVSYGFSNTGLIYGKNINIDEIGSFKKGIATSNTISIYGKDQTPFIEKNYSDGVNKFGMATSNNSLKIYSSSNIILTSSNSDLLSINRDNTINALGTFKFRDSSFSGPVIIDNTLTVNKDISGKTNINTSGSISGDSINTNSGNIKNIVHDSMTINKSFNMYGNEINFNNPTIQDWYLIKANSKNGINIPNNLSLPNGLAVGAQVKANNGELQIINNNKTQSFFNSNNSSINSISGDTTFNGTVNINKTLGVNTNGVKYDASILNNGGILTNNLYSYGTVQISDDKGNLARILSKDGVWGVSDKRLKKNIKPISETELSYINNIDPVKFNRYDSDDVHYGYIAQDVEKAYPNLVRTNENNDYKSLNYEEIIPIVAGNVKQLKKSLPNDSQLCLGKTCITEKDLINIMRK